MKNLIVLVGCPSTIFLTFLMLECSGCLLFGGLIKTNLLAHMDWDDSIPASSEVFCGNFFLNVRNEDDFLIQLMRSWLVLFWYQVRDWSLHVYVCLHNFNITACIFTFFLIERLFLINSVNSL